MKMCESWQFLLRIGTFVKFSGEKSERVINMKMHCCKCIVGNNLKDCP